MFSKYSLVSKPINSLINVFSKCSLSAIPKSSAGTSIGKKRFRCPVEKDVNKLMKYCCGANYYKDGEPIKLKEDSEYPEWLWKLPLVPEKLHQLDPNTKEYWEMSIQVGRQREARLKSITKRNSILVNKEMIKQLELKHLRRFRALAKYHYNAGHEVHEHHERDDTWNMHAKDNYRLEDDPRPFYPGIDKVDKPVYLNRFFRYKKREKIGHFGL